MRERLRAPRAGARAASTAALVAMSTLAGGGCQAPEPAPHRRPSVVLISIDSLRADRVGCYGHDRPTTPHLDRLAAEGARFRDAFSSSSWTLPAHAALFTSLPDATHGLVANGLSLGDAHLTLAEVFLEAGYETAGFFGGPYLHPTFGLAQGFETYESCMSEPLSALDEEALRADARQDDSASHRDVTGPRTLERVRAWLKRRDGKRPAFVFVHLWDVHYDYIPPEEHWRPFDPDYEGTLTGENAMTNPRIVPGMSERELRHLLALYDGEVHYTDAVMGSLHDELRESLGPETVTIVTADHGEEFFEHGWKGHQRTLFDEVVRIPLVIHAPGRVPPGTVANDLARLVDVYPTALALAGLSAPPGLRGRSLEPALRGEPLPPEPVLLDLAVGERPVAGLRSQHWKVLVHSQAGPTAGASAFFDLQADPREQHPRTTAGGPARAALGDFAARRQRASRARSHVRGPVVVPATTDPEVLRRLEALGYVGGGSR